MRAVISGKMKSIFLILLIKLFISIESVKPNEVVGCGGFIKSQKDIDFSKVEVKLLTKTGALKDKTDCSPSNGYYFLPIYDKGEYLLKISPPPGWSFEPEEVKLNFDGRSDVCSLGKDVNFDFKGFGITGKVALGSAAGAKGVKVELKSEDGKDTRHTTTDANGIFSFTPIIPGKYVVRASHTKWYFEKSEYTVVVESGNTVMPENSLVVSGFDVTGRFDTFGQLGSGVGIALFKSKKNSTPVRCSKPGPNTASVSHNNADYESTVSCYAAVDTAGDYIFKDTAPGKYIVVPVIENQNLKINIKPNFIEFEVAKDTFEVKQEFKISGFSVAGQILNAVEGSPVSGATVKLNGQKVSVTNSKGQFTLENIASSGSYSIQVEADKLDFVEQRIQLQLTSPTLPPIVPSSYEVCGNVVAKKSYKVGITKDGSTLLAVATNADTGLWCTFLPNGKFTVEVLTSDADRSNGVQFFPVQQTIEVKNQPLKDIVFSQLRATLQGTLQCLSDAPELSCKATDVTLHSLDVNGQPTGQKQSTKAHDGQYTFRNVLPGPYEITVPQSNLCFDSTRVMINVATASEKAPDFVQHGYEVTIISSHRVIMKYSHSSATSADNLKLLSGLNAFCVPKFGSYSIKLEGCHLYDEKTLPSTFSTASTSPITLNAVAHKVGVRVLSPESSVDSLKLTVESASLGKLLITPTAEAHKVDGKFAFRYDTHLKPEEVLTLSPTSDILLFEPQIKEIVGTNDCVDVAFNFVASKGLILRGKVLPAIKDAKITLSFPHNPDIMAQETLTSASGEFKFGPISDSLKYELKGEKESYVFTDFNPSTNSFSVHKLCEIIVKVKDEAGKGLSGVLISLSGAESYRKNLITADDGSINFHSLSPSQYFLRPMLKEFKFDPNSKMIDLKNGETVEVEMIGKRVAYSLYGAVTSLNGEPFPDVNIEATADEKCSHHQEEAATEKNGKYRIRGLNPGCDYTIRVKDAGTPRNNVDRSIPSTRSAKISSEDVHGVNFLAISPITFVDVTARVTASSNDIYKTLRVIMYRKGAYDSPVYSQRLDTPLNPKSRYNPGIMVFFPRIPLDGKTYIVELRSTLSDKTYTYSVPNEQFVADTPSVYVELDFKPEVKSYEADLNQNSISALVLVGLVAIAFFKQDIAMAFLNFVWSKINGIAQDLAQKQKTNAKNNQRKVAEPINQKEIEQMAEQINNIKKKKTKKI